MNSIYHNGCHSWGASAELMWLVLCDKQKVVHHNRHTNAGAQLSTRAKDQRGYEWIQVDETHGEDKRSGNQKACNDQISDTFYHTHTQTLGL